MSTHMLGRILAQRRPGAGQGEIEPEPEGWSMRDGALTRLVVGPTMLSP